jgi:hypothetical protein
MRINLENVKNLFKYHPPINPERVAKHKRWNSLCVEFAQATASVIDSPDAYVEILKHIQNIRMIGNAEITFVDIGMSYEDIFEEED